MPKAAYFYISSTITPQVSVAARCLQTHYSTGEIANRVMRLVLRWLSTLLPADLILIEIGLGS